MTMKSKLSIIIPIYGVEEYLDRFLKSLIPNLIHGIEVILVDDGSKDNSGLIIDEFQRQHEDHVTVFHKENGGVSSARNAGLKLAKSEYIAFADPDDYLAEEYTHTIFDFLLQFDNPDMIYFDFYDCCGDKKTLIKTSDFENNLVTKKDFLEQYFSGNFRVDTLWHKVIKRELLENNNFDETINCGEDVVFLLEVVFKLDKIVYLPVPLYHYCDRNDSLTKIDALEHKKYVYEAMERAYLQCRDCGIVAIGAVVSRAYELLRTAYIRGNINNEINEEKYECFIKQNITNILFNRDVNKNLKRQCLLVWLGLAKQYNIRKYKRN